MEGRCAESLYVANSETGNIAVYDPGSDSPVRTIALGHPSGLSGQSPPWSLAEDSRCDIYVWSGATEIDVFRPSGTTPQRLIPTNYSVYGMAFDAQDNLFVADFDPRIGVINEFAAGTNEIKQKYPALSAGPVFVRSGTLVAAALSKQYHPIVALFAPTDPISRRTMPVRGTGDIGAIVYDMSGNMYVVNQLRKSTSIVSEYDTNESFLRSYILPNASIVSGRGLQQAAIDHHGDLYIANAMDGSVTVFKNGTGRLLRRVTVNGMKASAILFDSLDELFVASTDSGRTGSVFVFAPYSTHLVRTIKDGVAGPEALILGPQ